MALMNPKWIYIQPIVLPSVLSWQKNSLSYKTFHRYFLPHRFVCENVWHLQFFFFTHRFVCETLHVNIGLYDQYFIHQVAFIINIWSMYYIYNQFAFIINIWSMFVQVWCKLYYKDKQAVIVPVREKDFSLIAFIGNIITFISYIIAFIGNRYHSLHKQAVIVPVREKELSLLPSLEIILKYCCLHCLQWHYHCLCRSSLAIVLPSFVIVLPALPSLSLSLRSSFYIGNYIAYICNIVACIAFICNIFDYIAFIVKIILCIAFIGIIIAFIVIIGNTVAFITFISIIAAIAIYFLH